MAGGVPAGRLSIEIVAEIARLQADLDQAKRLVNSASSEIAKNAKYANDNLAAIGATAGRSGQEYAAAGRQIVNSAGQQKFGMRDLGFQLSDVAVQFSGGTRAAIIFAQQGPQIVQAIQMMSGGAGKFATFMAGGWGVALMVGVAVLGTLVSKLTEASDATKKVEFATNALKDVQGIMAGVFNTTTGSINTQSKALMGLANAQILVARVQAQARQAEARSQIADLQGKGFGQFASQFMMQGPRAAFQTPDTAGISQRVLNGTNTPKQAIDQLENLRKAGRLSAADFSKAAAAVANYGVETENLGIIGKGVASITTGKLDPALRETAKAHKDAADHADRHAEALQRNSDAIEAQIAGLYKMADAYLDSDAAALKAEISAKAVADGIKKEADVAEYVAQQLRLVAAQRTADGAKSVAGMRQQSDAQQIANNQVAQGLMTSEQAQKYLKSEAELRPLIAAQAIAEGAAKQKLTDVIAAMRIEQKRSNDETARAQSLARVEALDKQTAAVTAENGLNSDVGSKRLGILASDLNYAQQAEALRQLNVEQEQHLILLKAEQDIKNLPAGADSSETDAIMRKAQADAASVSLKSGIDAAADAMTRLHDAANNLDLSSAFGAGGDAVNSLIGSIEKLQQAQVDYNTLMESVDPAVRAKADKDYTKAKINNTSQMLSASKKFFNEESAGYKIITAAEKILAAIQLANTIKSMVMDTTKTASSVANAGVRTAADTAAGGAKMFAFLGPFAFPVVAAMIAVMASLGFKGGGDSSAPAIPTAEDLQKAAGTGSVLGDSSAKSNSIANSLEIVASNTNKDLEYSNSMLKALHAIEDGISKMAGTVAKQIQVAGGMFDTTGAKLGSSGSGGFLGMFSSSTTRELWDVGMDLASTTVGNILAKGITGNTYQIVQQIKKNSGFFGIGGGTKTTYETTTGQIDPSITSAIDDVMASLRQGLIEASKVVGIDGADAIIDNFQIAIGRISFKDMTGQEIEDQLNAIFSKVGDDLAGAIMPGLKNMQLIGEGLYETFNRVAREYQVVDVSLKSIGLTFGAVGVSSLEARDNLVQLFGSLDDFVSATDFYRENFLTDAEQIAPIFASVTDELARLGLASVDTIDEFKGVVNGLDLTTQAGRDTFAALMTVAPAFKAVEDYQDKAAKAWTDRADALSDYRDSLTAATTASSFALISAQYRMTANAAGMGDATALDGLKSASDSFLAAAKTNATSQLDYARAQAEVLNNLDSGIAAANSQADLARRTTAAVESMATDVAATQQLTAQLTASVAALNRKIDTVTDGDALKVTSSDDTPFSVDIAA